MEVLSVFFCTASFISLLLAVLGAGFEFSGFKYTGKQLPKFARLILFGASGLSGLLGIVLIAITILLNPSIQSIINAPTPTAVTVEKAPTPIEVATAVKVEPPAFPTNPPVTDSTPFVTNICGAWQVLESGGYLIFSYDEYGTLWFAEYDAFYNLLSYVGSVTYIDSNTISIEGINYVNGAYEGDLYISGNTMAGTIYYSTNQASVNLVFVSGC